MSEPAELLLEMHKIQVARSEHYEKQRAAITNVVLTIAAGLLTVATFDGLSRRDLWTGLLVGAVGLLGLIACQQHSARSRQHGKRAEAYRNALDFKVPDAGINKVRESVTDANTYLFRTWYLIHVFVIAMGVLVYAFALLAS